MRWIRSNRRVSGSDWRNPNAERHTGPWHVLSDGPYGGTLVRCGKVMKMLAVERTAPGDEPPDDEKRCRACEIAVADGKQRPVRR